MICRSDSFLFTHPGPNLAEVFGEELIERIPIGNGDFFEEDSIGCEHIYRTITFPSDTSKLMV